jgi:hypothetical protein
LRVLSECGDFNFTTAAASLASRFIRSRLRFSLSLLSPHFGVGSGFFTCIAFEPFSKEFASGPVPVDQLVAVEIVFGNARGSTSRSLHLHHRLAYATRSCLRPSAPMNCPGLSRPLNLVDRWICGCYHSASILMFRQGDPHGASARSAARR